MKEGWGRREAYSVYSLIRRFLGNVGTDSNGCNVDWTRSELEAGLHCLVGTSLF